MLCLYALDLNKLNFFFSKEQMIALELEGSDPQHE